MYATNKLLIPDATPTVNLGDDGFIEPSAFHSPDVRENSPLINEVQPSSTNITSQPVDIRPSSSTCQSNIGLEPVDIFQPEEVNSDELNDTLKLDNTLMSIIFDDSNNVSWHEEVSSLSNISEPSNSLSQPSSNTQPGHLSPSNILSQPSSNTRPGHLTPTNSLSQPSNNTQPGHLTPTNSLFQPSNNTLPGHLSTSISLSEPSRIEHEGNVSPSSSSAEPTNSTQSSVGSSSSSPAEPSRIERSRNVSPSSSSSNPSSDTQTSAGSPSSSPSGSNCASSQHGDFHCSSTTPQLQKVSFSRRTVHKVSELCKDARHYHAMWTAEKRKGHNKKEKKEKRAYKKKDESKIDTKNMTEEQLIQMVQDHFVDLKQNHKILIGLMLTKTNKSSGRRYSLDEKLLTLKYKANMGSHGYEVLRSDIPCPSQQTHQELIKDLPIKAGFSKFMVDNLESLAEKLDAKEKKVNLVWDEMSLSSFLDYHKVSDRIIGYEDWGTNRGETDVADHALVFMIRSLKGGWVIPLSYSFCLKATKGTQLERCIKDHVWKLERVGFDVITFNCDRGTPNKKAIDELRRESEAKRNRAKQNGDNIKEGDTLLIEGSEIIHLFDVPHMVKSFRNSWEKYHLAFEDENGETHYADFATIKAAYDIDKQNEVRKMPKLTAEHFALSNQKKMKVSLAAQVLSGDVTDYLVELSNDNKIEPAAALAASHVTRTLNDLFDSCNANGEEVVKKGKVNDLRKVVTKGSRHEEVWDYLIQELRRWEFVDKETKKRVPGVDCIEDLIDAIKAMKAVWKRLQKLGFTEFNTKIVNQDCLESFFGDVRAHRGRDNNPSPLHFMETFKCLLLQEKGLRKRGANVENVIYRNLLSTMLMYFERTELPRFGSFERDEQRDRLEHDQSDSPSMVEKGKKNETIKEKALKHVSRCDTCRENLASAEYDASLKAAETAITELLKEKSHFVQLKITLFEDLREHWSFSWNTCEEHRGQLKLYVSSQLLEATIVAWCSASNLERKRERLELLAQAREEKLKIKRKTPGAKDDPLAKKAKGNRRPRRRSERSVASDVGTISSEMSVDEFLDYLDHYQ